MLATPNGQPIILPLMFYARLVLRSYMWITATPATTLSYRTPPLMRPVKFTLEQLISNQDMKLIRKIITLYLQLRIFKLVLSQEQILNLFPHPAVAVNYV